ncbi:MAG: formylglycine-generating enzyme family protein, partial [Planctomycetota bacterium]
GRVYRLPTEAQWEYACRAGSTTAYCFGDDMMMLEKYAWHGSNSRASTVAVGQKRPNAWGLYDMHGNVLEWCADWYDQYPSEACVDPVGPDKGYGRVFRGGAFDFNPELCGSAFRSMNHPTYRMNNLGFRVAMECL